MRSGGRDRWAWLSPCRAPSAHLEGQLHEDDAPGQCPLQVVRGDGTASALQKGKRRVQGQGQGAHQPRTIGEKVPWVSDFNGVRLGSMTSVITQSPPL